MEFAAPGTDAEVLDRADHVVEAHEVGTPEETENERAEERADEALDGLLWRECNEGGAANGDTPNIGEDVVADDKGGRNPEPNETLKDVVHNEVAEGTTMSEAHCKSRIRRQTLIRR